MPPRRRETGQTQTGASLRVEDGTRSARVERGGRGTNQCCNVRAKMEEPSIHGSIGDINSAETTKSKCESVNIKLFSISSFERRMTSLRNLSYGRYATMRTLPALDLILFWIYIKDLCIFTVKILVGTYLLKGLKTLVNFSWIIFYTKRPSYFSRFKVSPDFRDLFQTLFATLPIQHDDILRSIFFFGSRVRNNQPKSQKKRKEKYIFVSISSFRKLGLDFLKTASKTNRFFAANTRRKFLKNDNVFAVIRS